MNTFTPFRAAYVLTCDRAVQVRQQAEPLHCIPLLASVVHRSAHSAALHKSFAAAAAVFSISLPGQLSGINHLQSRDNYSATSNNIKLVHWPLMGGRYIWYSEEGTGRGHSPQAPPHCTKCNSQSPCGCIMVCCSAILMCS